MLKFVPTQMGGSEYANDRYSDRYYRSDRDYGRRDQRSNHARDSRDSYRSDYNQRRVPGLVSDPDRHLSDIESAIQRGQRETVIRVQSDRYSSTLNNNVSNDAATALTVHHPAPMTVTQNYSSPSFRDSYRVKPKRSLYNPAILAFFPGLAGFALIITAIVLVAWTTAVSSRSSTTNDGAPSDVRIDFKGLFHVCTTVIQDNSISDIGCVTLEDFADAGTEISSLEQATRAMMIIAAIIGFVAWVVSLVLGFNKLEQPKGAIFAGALHAFAGACGTAGMGCFSAVLVDNINSTSVNGTGFVSAGTSFYFGWVGTGLLFIAAITSFLGHCARWKRK